MFLELELIDYKIILSIDEQLQPWDNEDKDQFVKDHTGLKIDPANVRITPIPYHTGLIWEDRENTPEQQMALDELYRSLDRSIPATYDARAKGNVVGLHFYFNQDRYLSTHGAKYSYFLYRFDHIC